MMSDGVQHGYDPEAEAMRRIAFGIAVTAVERRGEELQREVKRSRWWTMILMVCVGLNLGSVLVLLQWFT
jgi:predicted CDP-diglyceride synthetase/phosphatidate cytidylyltransferase